MRASWMALLVMTLLSSRGLAQSPPPRPRDAEHARIGFFSAADRQVLAPHLERGPLALVEFSAESDLPAIIFAAKVHAPAADVAHLLANPRGYPSFMPALDSVRVRSEREDSVAYDWTWRTAIFTLRGSNVMQIYPDPRGRRDRPWRVESTATSGDMGTGRFVWRVYAEDPSSCLVILSSRVDLRRANFFTRQFENGAQSINRTINLALAYVMIAGAKRRAEERAGVPAVDPGPRAALTRPVVDINALKFILIRGDLLLMNMTGDRLDQIAIVGRMGHGEARTREVMNSPSEFGPALVPGSYARITGQDEESITFDWGIDMPLVGTSGTMRMRQPEGGYEVDATAGAMNGGRWRFAIELYPWQEAVVVGWADFDPADAAWLIRAVVQQHSDFGHGITGGAQVMLVRAIRTRVWNRTVGE